MKPAVRSFITEYLGELVEGNAALFAGAGLSAAAGYVEWRELIRPLSVELELDIELEVDLVAVAQFHVNASGYNRHKLHKAVIEALSSDNPPTENHRLLANRGGQEIGCVAQMAFEKWPDLAYSIPCSAADRRRLPL
jgi:hypothetical protein